MNKKAWLKELDGGPLSWANWKANTQRRRLGLISEAKLFTDAWITNEVRDLGPYSFLNSLPHGPARALKPAVVLRTKHHVSQGWQMARTEDGHYHGGWLLDEVAALASLALGVRLTAGPVERMFHGRRDPRYDRLGSPEGHSADLLPALPRGDGRCRVPILVQDKNLGDLAVLRSLPNLSAADAMALIKSARMYQQAVWIADATPELSWLMLVSSIEIAASRWDAEQLSPEQRLERNMAPLVASLREIDARTVSMVASALDGLIGSSSKFVSFIVKFLPSPPAVRPPLAGQVDFRKVAMRKTLHMIYGYRSRALHGGTPFPAPMCDVPFSSSETMEERPAASARHQNGATWMRDDTPMLLHVFEHIVRGALVNWWRHLAAKGESGATRAAR